MVMFFGDPGTRGVKEDALACVKMAIAMQKRIGELAVDWQTWHTSGSLSSRLRDGREHNVRVALKPLARWA
jgi:hypothetical protein